MEKALNALSKGATKKQAAQVAGISTTILNEIEHEFPRFAEDIARARDAFEGILLDRIESAGRDPKYWGANVALAKMLWPHKYGAKIQVSGDPDKPAVQMEWANFTSEQIRELVKATR